MPSLNCATAIPSQPPQAPLEDTTWRTRLLPFVHSSIIPHGVSARGDCQSHWGEGVDATIPGRSSLTRLV
jgi:hypothetical protein